MRPTEFNKKVWSVLKLIPRGRVTTYKEIAKYLKKLKAARAVGNACHKNSHAPTVPCHRVVKSDGSLGGYSRGVNKKIKLLNREGIKVINNKIKNFEKVKIKMNY